MGVQVWSRSADGARKLSEHFTAGEFACRDGSDRILISGELVDLLEKLRRVFGAPVTVTSGYRTAEYNKKVGGAAKSQHLLGTAADIQVKGAPPRRVAQCADALGAGGVGLYEYAGGFTHVDVRSGRARWLQTAKNGACAAVASFGAWTGAAEREEEQTAAKRSESSDWAREAADWAVKQGLIKGDGTGEYQWQQPLTREALAVILKRYHEAMRTGEA